MWRTYEYRCDECNHEFEEVQSDTKAKKKCPKCGKMKLVRKFPCPAVHMRYSPCHPRAGRGRG